MCVGRVMQEQLPRRNVERIASYATEVATQKTGKKIRKALAILIALVQVILVGYLLRVALACRTPKR